MSKGSGSTRASSPTNTVSNVGGGGSKAPTGASIARAMTFKDAGGGMYSASVNDEHFIDIVKGEDSFGDTYYEIQDVYVTVNGAYMDVTPKDGLGYGGRRTFGTLNAAKASAKEHLQKAIDEKWYRDNYYNR